MQKPKPKLSATKKCDIKVIICTHDRMPLLRQTLDALQRAEPPQNTHVEILVVANACSQVTLTELTEAQGCWSSAQVSLHLIEVPKAGKSHALNEALSRLDARYACFIDDDQIVEPDFFCALVDAISRRPDHAMFCGWMLPAWDGSEPSWVHRRDEYMIPIRPFPEYDMGNVERDITPEMKLPSGGNIVMRHDVIASTGLFSVVLGPTGHNLLGGEDHDYIRRALSQGYRLLYVPTLKQRHLLEHERMTTRYMMRKCFLRSYSSVIVHDDADGFRALPSMLRKGFFHGVRAMLSRHRDQRFYWLMRLAATAGELRGQFHIGVRS